MRTPISSQKARIHSRSKLDTLCHQAHPGMRTNKKTLCVLPIAFALNHLASAASFGDEAALVLSSYRWGEYAEK